MHYKSVKDHLNKYHDETVYKKILMEMESDEQSKTEKTVKNKRSAVGILQSNQKQLKLDNMCQISGSPFVSSKTSEDSSSSKEAIRYIQHPTMKVCVDLATNHAAPLVLFDSKPMLELTHAHAIFNGQSMLGLSKLTCNRQNVTKGIGYTADSIEDSIK